MTLLEAIKVIEEYKGITLVSIRWHGGTSYSYQSTEDWYHYQYIDISCIPKRDYVIGYNRPESLGGDDNIG